VADKLVDTGEMGGRALFDTRVDALLLCRTQKGSKSTGRHVEWLLWVGSATSPRAKPALHQGLDAVHCRVPGLDGEAVAGVVDR
jgi:hypothetical protein